MDDVILDDWSIIMNMACGGDYLAPQGTVYNHHRILDGEWGIPGTFASFDSETMTGVSFSGTRWKLERFHPNGNAPTLEAAIAFIQKSWVKQS